MLGHTLTSQVRAAKERKQALTPAAQNMESTKLNQTRLNRERRRWKKKREVEREEERLRRHRKRRWMLDKPTQTKSDGALYIKGFFATEVSQKCGKLGACFSFPLVCKIYYLICHGHEVRLLCN
jgi:hypothetical protein